jgi:hypothetical protein
VAAQRKVEAVAVRSLRLEMMPARPSWQACSDVIEPPTAWSARTECRRRSGANTLASVALCVCNFHAVELDQIEAEQRQHLAIAPAGVQPVEVALGVRLQDYTSRRAQSRPPVSAGTASSFSERSACSDLADPIGTSHDGRACS